jgi:hypothetical protein
MFIDDIKNWVLSHDHVAEISTLISCYIGFPAFLLAVVLAVFGRASGKLSDLLLSIVALSAFLSMLFNYPNILFVIAVKNHDNLLSFFSDENQIPLMLAFGIVAFWLRQLSPQYYGLIECFVGGFAIAISMTSKDAVLQSRVLGVVGGIYIIVRGLDNIKRKSDWPESRKNDGWLDVAMAVIPTWIRKNSSALQIILFFIFVAIHVYYNQQFWKRLVMETLSA